VSFGRVVTIEIGTPGSRPRRLSSRDDRGDTALKFGVDVRRTSESQGDQCDVRMWGSADGTRAALQQPGAVCRVLVGLGAGPERPQGNPVQIFAGRVIPSSVDGPRKAGGDRILTWSITDGGYEIADTMIYQSWRGPVAVSSVIDEVIASSSLTRGAIVLGDPTARFRTAYAAADRLRKVLEHLADRTGSRVSIQHGAVEMWPIAGVRVSQGYTVSPASGLVEQPSRVDETRWSVRSILLTGVRPGDPLRVQSDTITGTMAVEDVSHAISSHDGPWETTIAGQVQ
jgi:hypothetical protein